MAVPPCVNGDIAIHWEWSLKCIGELVTCRYIVGLIIQLYTSSESTLLQAYQVTHSEWVTPAV